ncbi:MAG: TolB family protein, partial [Rhodothermales bacterium]
MLAPAAHAQVSPSFYDYARPTLDWYTIATDHFDIVFHADAEGEGSSRTAQVVARIAEDIYGPITALYGYQPDTKVSIILKDYEDYSNGAAYFFDNKIEIWSPALDAPLRGDHNWLRNVITHEFTHMVQVQTAMKAGRQLPFFYFQILDYEDVRRPDVLYGYPNVIISYPIATLNNPAWLAEGTAQYQRSWLDYDRWDTHRDMLLRTRVLAGEELSLVEMGSFYSKSSLMREGVYNHGFAFTHYLANTYGEEVLRDISRALGKWRNWNVERAIEEALGIPANEVYADWMNTMRQEYQARTESIRAHLVEGELVEQEGFSNFYPVFSPDGTKLAYVSNRGEHFNRMSLYVHDLASGETAFYDVKGQSDALRTFTCAFGHRIRTGVGGAVAWRPDGKAIVYARRRDTAEGYLFADLYELDLETKAQKRLTHQRRATLPAYAPDGARIVFVGQNDGTTNLFTLHLETGDFTRLTDYQDGSQVSDPAWHPSGQWIYFARLAPESHGRDLWRVQPDGSGLEKVYATEADERSPAFDPDGTHLYFSSDASGIFNLYRLQDDEATPERLTNVLGGAFMPSVSASGAVAYAHYQWDGYKIAMFDAVPVASEEARVATYAPPSLTQKQANLALATEESTQLN